MYYNIFIYGPIDNRNSHSWAYFKAAEAVNISINFNIICQMIRKTSLKPV